ncbi:MAG: hypothetical protein WCG94_07870, partial [Methanothrix sp.]
LMIVLDSWWHSAALIKSCRELGYHVTCQIKYVLEGLNLPITDEGGLLHRLKAIRPKVGK